MNNLEVANTVETNVSLKNPDLISATKVIKALTLEAKKNLFGIAVTLKRIDSESLYKEDGFKNTADYAQQVFGYKHAMTSALIRVAKQYLIVTNNDYCSIYADKDKDFSISQLQEMLPLTKKQADDMVKSESIKMDMTTKQIREIVKQEVKGNTVKVTKKDTAKSADSDKKDTAKSADSDKKDTAKSADSYRNTISNLHREYVEIYKNLKECVKDDNAIKYVDELFNIFNNVIDIVVYK